MKHYTAEQFSIDAKEAGAEAFMVVRIVHPHWAPAQAFWDAFQIYDPGGLMEIRADTAACALHFAKVTAAAYKEQPMNILELCEKIKIAAATDLVCWIKDGPNWMDEDGIIETKVFLKKLVLCDAARFCAEMIDKDFKSEDWFLRIVSTLAQNAKWHQQLVADRAALGRSGMKWQGMATPAAESMF